MDDYSNLTPDEVLDVVSTRNFCYLKSLYSVSLFQSIYRSSPRWSCQRRLWTIRSWPFSPRTRPGAEKGARSRSICVPVQSSRSTVPKAWSPTRTCPPRSPVLARKIVCSTFLPSSATTTTNLSSVPVPYSPTSGLASTATSSRYRNSCTNKRTSLFKRTQRSRSTLPCIPCMCSSTCT